MQPPQQHTGTAAERTAVRLDRLAPTGEPLQALDLVEELGLWERSRETLERPRVLLNMVSSVDGRATLEDRSGPLSNAADRALFHALRLAVDAVLVGAGTVRAERYGRIIPDPQQRELRRERGLSEEPLACIVSGRLTLTADVPLLSDPAARVVMLTGSSESLGEVNAQMEYVRAGIGGVLDLPAALHALAERFAVRTVLCEGGPHLACQLVADNLVDELFLTLSPMLAGGELADREALRILAGDELQPPLELELRGVLRHASQLFLRYGVHR